jgi:hypothetical protein
MKEISGLIKNLKTLSNNQEAGSDEQMPITKDLFFQYSVLP